MKHLTRILTLAQETREPTIASIPRILLRAIMHTVARVVLLLAAATFMLTVTLLSVSLILATFPSTHKRRG
jgi:hypothetical protein